MTVDDAFILLKKTAQHHKEKLNSLDNKSAHLLLVGVNGVRLLSVGRHALDRGDGSLATKYIQEIIDEFSTQLLFLTSLDDLLEHSAKDEPAASKDLASLIDELVAYLKPAKDFH